MCLIFKTRKPDQTDQIIKFLNIKGYQYYFVSSQDQLVWIANSEKQNKNTSVANILKIHKIYCDYTLKKHRSWNNFLIPIYLQPDVMFKSMVFHT